MTVAFQVAISVLELESTELHVRLSGESLIPIVSRYKPYWFSKPDVMGTHLPGAGILGRGPQCSDPLLLSQGPLWLWYRFYFRPLTQGVGLTRLHYFLVPLNVTFSFFLSFF